MSDLVPTGDDPDAGITPDVGVSIHEWRTRWEQIEEDREEAPGEALEEATMLLDEMLAELGIETRGTAAAETEDIVRTSEALHEVVDRWRGDGPTTRGELMEAFDEARTTFEYLVSGRHESEDDAS
jgi:sulfur carrier protein ThiS